MMDPKVTSKNLNIYVDSIYFVVLTATTVGYGDEVPTSVGEKVYTIFLQLAAILIFSLLVSSFRNIKREKKIITIMKEHVSLVRT